MTVTAPVPGFSLANLIRLAASLPLPSAALPSAQQRAPDVVVFSSAPLRLLSDLASAGLRQLTALLPALEQALQDESVAPLGHLAKSITVAARQVTDGHVALLAEGPERAAASLRGELPIPSTAMTGEARQLLRTFARQLGNERENKAPTESDSETPTELAPDARTDETLRTIARQVGSTERLASTPARDSDASPIELWLAEAKQVLRNTGDALDRADEHLRSVALDMAPVSRSTALAEPPSAWALAQVAAAQLQVAAAYGSLGQSLRGPRRLPRAITAGTLAIAPDHLAAATTGFGMLLVLATLWLAGGIWSVITGTVGLIAIGLWVVRISRASSGIALDPGR